MGRTIRRIAASLLCIAVIVPWSASSAAAITAQDRAKLGIGFIAGAQRRNGSIPAFSPIGSTSDAILAFVATGIGRPRVKAALAYLRRQVIAGNVEGVGLQAKVIMAVTSAGRDPRSFADANLLRELRSQIGDDGHIGDAAVFDQALGVLALESAGLMPAAKVTGWLADAQCPDGGWAYDLPYTSATDDDHCDDGSGTDFFTSDSNTTSYAVQSLYAAGRGKVPADPFSYFEAVRDPLHRGWAYSTGFIATDTNSTALVLQAHAAAGVPAPTGGPKALRQLQDLHCGAWAFTWDGDEPGVPDVGATIGAIPGILGIPFPLGGPIRPAVPPVIAC